jgi:hypothetical protein
LERKRGWFRDKGDTESSLPKEAKLKRGIVVCDLFIENACMHWHSHMVMLGECKPLRKRMHTQN